MRWTERICDSKLLLGAVIPEMEAKTHSAIFAAVAGELWQQFCQRVLPLHRNIEWNACRVDMWTESGKIVVYPDDIHSEVDVAVAGLEVTSIDLRNHVKKRLHSGGSVDQAAEEIEMLELRIAEEFCSATQSIGLSRQVGKSCLHILFCMPGDNEPFFECEA